jgi:hypothetical protein
MRVLSFIKLGGFVAIVAISVTANLSSSAMALGAYGADTCKQGFVWREAFADDTVCVTPGERTLARKQNQKANLRKNPFGGAYGPDTCRNGYVWRDATEGDHVCVTPGERSQAAQQNADAPARYENAA